MCSDHLRTDLPCCSSPPLLDDRDSEIAPPRDTVRPVVRLAIQVVQSEVGHGADNSATMTRDAPSDPLERCLEESQGLGLVRVCEATNGGMVFVYLNDRLGNNIHVGLGVHPSRDGEPDKLEPRMPGTTRNGVTPRRDVASLHTPHT